MSMRLSSTVLRWAANAAAALVAAATVLPTPRALAADLDYGYGEIPPPIAETKLEFGSGWYIRGDIGATRLPSIGLVDPTQTGKAPVASLNSGSKLGYTASLGAGYSFNRWFRADAVFDFHQPLTMRKYGSFFPSSPKTGGGIVNNNGKCQLGYAGYTNNGTDTFYEPYYEDCSSNYDASITSYDFLVNGYIDLGHFGAFTPYIGAGIGMAFGHYSAATAYTNPDGTSYNTYFNVPGDGITIHGYNDNRTSGNYYNFAFAATAGVAIDIYPHTKLDINYRYLHLGEVLGANLATHEARAGLRYMIDN